MDRFNEEELLKFIREVEENDMLTAPTYLKDETIKKSQNLSNTFIVQQRKTSKNMQLFCYSMKISVAVLSALFFVFCIPMITSKEAPKTYKTSQLGNKLSNQISNYTNGLAKAINQSTTQLLEEKEQ